MRAFAPGIAPCAILAVLLSISTNFAGSATWQTNPSSGSWNTATNWMPNTVPNAASDTATFQSSNVTNLSLSAPTEVDGINFNVGASAFAIATAPAFPLTISGRGITNQSGIMQHFAAQPDPDGGRQSGFIFRNSATAGTATTFSVTGGVGVYSGGGRTTFADSSSADHATFEISNSSFYDFNSAGVVFTSNATAGHGLFTTMGGTSSRIVGGYISFSGSATAGDGTFTNNGGAGSGARGGRMVFVGSGTSGIASTAGSGIFINNGGTASGANGGSIDFVGNRESPTPANGTFINNAGTVDGAFGGRIDFNSEHIGNATLIANGGPGEGGSIRFIGVPVSGTARVEVYGNGKLDLSRRLSPGGNDTIGSLQGNGLVFLGANNLTVGSNDLSTAFFGEIQDGGFLGGAGGSLTKIGSGKLVLGHRSSYTGGTIINGGKLVVNNVKGSGTGSGPVAVIFGRLGGTGIIAGDVTIGNGTGGGAVLTPGNNTHRYDTLTIQSALSFGPDGTYNFTLNTNEMAADKVVAQGVTIKSGAQFSFFDVGGAALTPGTTFTVINNTAANPIAGTFRNLSDGSIFGSNGNSFKASYHGGDGNDLTLTVVP